MKVVFTTSPRNCLRCLLLAVSLTPSRLWASEDAYDDEAPLLPMDEPEEEQEETEEEEPEAGGLTAPGAMTSEASSQAHIEEQLQQAGAKDSGRGLHFVVGVMLWWRVAACYVVVACCIVVLCRCVVFLFLVVFPRMLNHVCC